MATLSVQTKSALALVGNMAAAASGGDEVPNANGRTVLVIANRHASAARTVTLTSTRTKLAQGTAASNLATVIAAGKVAVIGPLDKASWNNVSGRVALSYSDSAADIFVGAYEA